MKRIKSLQLLFICIITSILCFNCGGGGGSAGDKPDGNAQFLSFSINGLDGVIVDTNISVVLPNGTDISSLVATFTIKGVSVKVNDVEQQSGITINNYSAPVEYVVYSENGTSVKYTITVTVASSGSKEITAFSINGTSGSITGSSIGLTLPYGTNVNNLIASFSSTGNSVTVNGTAQVSGSSSNNFSSPVIYRVHAADGSYKDYTVTVTVASSSSKEITAFSINGISGSIMGSSIGLTLPYGTNVNNLIATFSSTGNSVTVNGTTQVSGSSSNNFSSPVIYRVHAADGSNKDYTITVTVALNSAKEITSFSLNGYSGTISGTAINVYVSSSMDKNNLVASFASTGNAVTVNGVTQVSGSTSNNYTNPLTYRVHAEDGGYKDYIVSVYYPDGSSDHPFEVNTYSDLKKVCSCVDGWAGTKHYIQTADIDASPSSTDGFEPLCNSSNELYGSYDGNNHKISNLTIAQTSTDYIGLFSYVNGSIKNLILENISVSGKAYVGGLVAYHRGTGSHVTNITISGSINGVGYVGGLAGTIAASVENCTLNVSVTGTHSYIGGIAGMSLVSNINGCISAGSVNGVGLVGGLVGYFGGTIVNCCSTASISSSASSAGGLVGDNYGSIINSYATGIIAGYIYVGGLVGQNYGYIQNCYSTGQVTGTSGLGGLVARNSSGTADSCYWDITTSGQATSALGTGKTTSEMKQEETYSGWDFVNIWSITSGLYPYLR